MVRRLGRASTSTLVGASLKLGFFLLWRDDEIVLHIFGKWKYIDLVPLPYDSQTSKYTFIKLLNPIVDLANLSMKKRNSRNRVTAGSLIIPPCITLKPLEILKIASISSKWWFSQQNPCFSFPYFFMVCSQTANFL
jgi:hypothetical protein